MGIEGFNNQAEGGQKVWQSPISQSIWRLQMEHDALQQNTRKCLQMIQRKLRVGVPNVIGSLPEQVGQQTRIIHHQFPPSQPSQIPITYAPPPTVLPFTPPVYPSMQHPMHPQYFGMQSPVSQGAPLVPRAFHVQPTQNPKHLPAGPPQPTVAPVNPTARIMPQPVSAEVKPEIIPPNVQEGTLRDDINRLEAEMTRLVALISKEASNAA
jgi:hypothetical protein